MGRGHYMMGDGGGVFDQRYVDMTLVDSPKFAGAARRRMRL